jgi:bacteriocin-like protein
MKDNKMTVKLNDEQQKQIRDTTGRNITELHIDFGTAHLTEKELEQVVGGRKASAGQQEFIKFTFSDLLVSSF